MRLGARREQAARPRCERRWEEVETPPLTLPFRGLEGKGKGNRGWFLVRMLRGILRLLGPVLRHHQEPFRGKVWLFGHLNKAGGRSVSGRGAV